MASSSSVESAVREKANSLIRLERKVDKVYKYLNKMLGFLKEADQELAESYFDSLKILASDWEGKNA